ncbi:ubiquitin-conjugating enzyme E2 Z-like [Dermacentor albipictus]|uniref:ubiquitin-conjugating enzyme E2 Z-like n=1 Tax=Dermacentor albipictus TaxID=60249 RepID=UPI0031FD0E23
MSHERGEREAPELGLTSYLEFWDPLRRLREQPSPLCILETKRALVDIYSKPVPGNYVVTDQDDVTRIQALLLGPAGTPYEGGFFWFVMRCQPEYPAKPPQVRLMTTDGGRVRFGPNFNESGMICLSILGTWPGTTWKPADRIRGVLNALLSLMTEEPYFNEPALVKRKEPGEASGYNDYLRHETIRVAVCNTVEACLQNKAPQDPRLQTVILNAFVELYGKYVELVQGQLHLTGCEMKDPFSSRTVTCRYHLLLARLQGLYRRIVGE